MLILQLGKTEAERSQVICSRMVEDFYEPWHSGFRVQSSQPPLFLISLFLKKFSFPKFHPSLVLSSLSLYLLYKGHHWIPWSQLLVRVSKFDFLYQLATVFSSVYQHIHIDLPNLLNPNRSQIEFIFLLSHFFSHINCLKASSSINLLNIRNQGCLCLLIIPNASYLFNYQIYPLNVFLKNFSFIEV